MANKIFNDVKLKVTFTKASTRANITSGENLSTSLGKIAKWFGDFNAVVWNGNASKVNGHTVAADVPSGAKFTDANVTQNNSTADAELRVLLSKSANDTNETSTTNKSSKLTMNPSTGALSVTTSTFGGLKIDRNSANFASVVFENSNGLLGSVGMNEVNGSLIRHLFNDTEPGGKITILDKENTSFTRSLSSGTKIGTIDIGGTATDIYAPTNTNTTYTIASGDSNGQIKVTPSSGSAYNVSVKGLGSAAYTASSAYATSSHTHNYLPLTGGTVSGTVKISESEYLNQLIVNRNSALADAISCVQYQVNDSIIGVCGFDVTNKFHVQNSQGNDTLTVGTNGELDAVGTITSKKEIITQGQTCQYSGDGLAGYYCIAQFKITTKYVDAPIEIEVSDRKINVITTFTIRFASENSADPAIGSFTYRGAALTAYVCKSATSTWQLWVNAAQTYSALTIHSIKSYSLNKLEITYPESYLSSANFGTAIATGGSLATNTRATTGDDYQVAAANQWITTRTINGMNINGTANRVNYGSCSTAAATAAKVVNCIGYSLQQGGEITVKFNTTNTASSPTLNVNSTGAKPIYYRGKAITAGYLASGRTYTFRYNGAQYDLVGDINTDTDTKLTQSNLAVSSTNNKGLKLPLLLANKAANSGNSYSDGSRAVTCKSTTNTANMTGLAWLETDCYTDGSSSGKPYATICCESFKCVGDGQFEGNATSASRVYSELSDYSSTAFFGIPFTLAGGSGNKTLRTNDGLIYKTLNGSTSSVGKSILSLGNSKTSTTDGNKAGSIMLYTDAGGDITVNTDGALNGSRTQTLPNANGFVNISKILYASTGTSQDISVSGINTDMYDYFTIFVYTAQYLSSFAISKGAMQRASINGTHYVDISCPAGSNATITLTKYDGTDVTSSNPPVYFQRIIGHKCS